MKIVKIIFFIFAFFVFSNLSSNPLIPYFISEIYFEEENWFIELSDELFFGLITNFDDCFLASQSDTVAFNNGIEFAILYALVVDQSFLQDSLFIDPAGDRIKFFDNEEFYDEVVFGNLPGSGVNAPQAGQSLARIVRYYDMSTEYFLLLVKENSPSLGEFPYQVTTRGTISGYVYDINEDPVTGALIKLTQGAYQLEMNSNDNGYFFNDNLYGMNYQLELRVPPTVTEYLDITIEPDSTSTFIFNTNYDPDGIATNEIVKINSYLTAIPNPFNPSTLIEYNLAENINSNECAIEIYNVKGQKLTKIPLTSRSSSFIWQAENQPSGVYYISLNHKNKELAQTKVTLLK
jgi:hypothetical protein